MLAAGGSHDKETETKQPPTNKGQSRVRETLVSGSLLHDTKVDRVEVEECKSRNSPRTARTCVIQLIYVG